MLFTFLILGVLLILFILAGIFAGLETAMSSINVIRLEHLYSEPWHQKKIGKIKFFITNFSKTIASIAISNNIMLLASSTLSSLLFAYWISNDNTAMGISLAFTTVIAIIFCEILPKHIARNNREKFAVRFLVILEFGYYVFLPILLLFGKILHTKKEVATSEEELLLLIDNIKKEGVIDRTENTLIKKAVLFDDTKVKQIYIPWKKVVYVYSNAIQKEVMMVFKKTGFSRLPVINSENSNHVTGVIDFKTFSLNYSSDKKMDSEHFWEPPVCYPDENYQETLEKFKYRKTHLGIVYDRSDKSIIGIITLEDLVEQLIGLIHDEHDEQQKIKKINDETYICNGDLKVSELLNLLPLTIRPPKNRNISLDRWTTILNHNLPLLKNGLVFYDSLTIQKSHYDSKLKKYVYKITF